MLCLDSTSLKIDDNAAVTAVAPAADSHDNAASVASAVNSTMTRDVQEFLAAAWLPQ